MIIKSEIVYQGTRQKIRMEKAERVPVFYLFIGDNPYYYLVGFDNNDRPRCEKLDQETLDLIECILIAAYQ